MNSEPASEEYCYLAEGGGYLKKESASEKTVYILVYTFLYITNLDSVLSISSYIHGNPHIFKLRHIFKVHNSYLYIAILSCVLITRHK